jgi:hypothetical protein
MLKSKEKATRNSNSSDEEEGLTPRKRKTPRIVKTSDEDSEKSCGFESEDEEQPSSSLKPVKRSNLAEASKSKEKSKEKSVAERDLSSSDGEAGPKRPKGKNRRIVVTSDDDLEESHGGELKDENQYSTSLLNQGAETRESAERRKSEEKSKAKSAAELKGIDEHLYTNSNKKIETSPEIDSESDREDSDSQNEIYTSCSQTFVGSLSHVVEMGVRSKLLANVYLRKVDGTANIFLPFYSMKFSDSDKPKQDFFRTKKNKICVFASGGLQNTWESTVSNVQTYFLGEEVKIIRAYWTQKHLWKDKGIRCKLDQDFQGRESELHSEFYYDLFFRNFFLPEMPNLTEGHTEKLESITIYAFSWWDVCDSCEEKYLGKHQFLLNKHLDSPGSKIKLSYKIAASRNYQHHPGFRSIVESTRVSATLEPPAWKETWASVLKYVRKPFENDEAKEKFWTRTKEGLEVCKWLGQAFVENTVLPNVGRAKYLKKGDVLKYYAKVDPSENEELNRLLGYLRQENWELSCWYRSPKYVNRIQGAWKINWRQIVMPHFGWEEVFQGKADIESICEMCGNDDVWNISLIFHPKFRVSTKFLNLSEQDQEMRAADHKIEPSPRNLPEPLQQKRKQSICVGSECVKVLTYLRDNIGPWLEKNPWEAREAKRKELDERVANDELIEQLDKKLNRRTQNTSESSDEDSLSAESTSMLTSWNMKRKKSSSDNRKVEPRTTRSGAKFGEW